MSEPRVSWQRIRHVTYMTIYIEFERPSEVPRDQGRTNALQVFGVHTCHDGECFAHSQTHVYTEWGIQGADAPLIRSIRDGEEWTYWIAVVKGGEDE